MVWLATAQSSAFLLFVVAYGVSACLALAFLLGHRRFDALESEQRAQVGFYALCAPLLVGVLTLLAGFLPSILDSAGWVKDHCLAGHAGHPHLCFVHYTLTFPGADLPSVIGSILAAGALYRVMATAAQRARLLGPLRLLFVLADLEAGRELAGRLAAAGMPWPGQIKVVQIPLPLCLVTGVTRPILVISTRVLEALPHEDLLAVVAHERAHVQRSDNLLRLVTLVAGVFHVPGFERFLRAQWLSASEDVCDVMAARAARSGVPVAAALVALQRLMNGYEGDPKVRQFHQLGAAALQAHAAIEPRVRQLMTLGPKELDAMGPFSNRVIATLAASFVLLLLVLSPDLHHGLETLLGFIGAH